MNGSREFLAICLSNKKLKYMKNVFIHHVFFWLKDRESETSLAKLRDGLLGLSAVRTIRKFHIGMAAPTDRAVIENSYSISWLVLFDNEEDQASYQVDPIHLQFVSDCAELWDKVLVYDSVDLQ
jgi:hypothetical protein